MVITKARTRTQRGALVRECCIDRRLRQPAFEQKVPTFEQFAPSANAWWTGFSARFDAPVCNFAPKVNDRTAAN
jgi:hypothetical protein